ncbi:MAG: BREX-1 system adenine-specific DNA-methyltransferase PglX [Endozoicomonadaceae bacterium]|nr:BREX-1 system adenine-specific DNA-methyltransferase PglX [Endozoicomonadaceae bacterium]
MNTANIKKYAPKARIAFQKAIKARANKLGIYSDHIDIATIAGDVMQIGDKQFPANQKSQRDALERQVIQNDFDSVMDLVASTWFNRLCAIRFMELKEYLDHGFRVLSHPEQVSGFQILENAADVAEDLGLNRAEVLELTLQSNKEEELYRTLLLAQCHSLHDAMDFLFDRVDDVSALLLPDGLTRTDSVLRQLIDDVPEEDWSQVEIIGWLYQFYISEKKDEVIGKVVKSEDIPAATQLFTPNWIVQYLVQNSVGRQWLQTYPDSSIKEDMPYYIEPAEQSDEVNVQLTEITPDTLHPESIKVLDPACGSGHILVEAYNTLKVIYDERGYKAREIPKLILENNLYGLDIDDRAAQLASFALIMMAREDDRRIFTRGVKLNVLSLQETSHLDLAKLWYDLDLAGNWEKGISADLFGNEQTSLSDPQVDKQYSVLLDIQNRFLQAKTLGSLIEVPAEQLVELKALLDTLRQKADMGNTAQRPAAQTLIPFVQQAWILSQRYDSVVANPPYMGGKFYTQALKTFIYSNYQDSKADLYSAFIEQNTKLSAKNGFIAMITIPNWMFLSSFEPIRKIIVNNQVIDSLIHNGRGVWGSDFGSCSFVIRNFKLPNYKGTYKKLFQKQGSIASNEDLVDRFYSLPNFETSSEDLKLIPGFPISYWINNDIRTVFKNNPCLSDIAKPKVGMRTGNNEKFLRYWHEVPLNKLKTDSLGASDAEASSCKWVPFVKGGDFRKWFGNIEFVVNWESNGLEIKSETLEKYPQLSWDNLGWKISNEKYYFRKAVTWTAVSSSYFGCRFIDEGNIFGTGGSCIFPDDESMMLSGALLCSSISRYLINIGNPTVNINIEDVAMIPFIKQIDPRVKVNAQLCKDISKDDWNRFERSWEFKRSNLVNNSEYGMISFSYDSYLQSALELVDSVKNAEEENNKLLVDAYGLSDEVDIIVPLNQITLTSNPCYRYGKERNSDDTFAQFRSESFGELVNYSIGCMMGRYSLDRDGLVYANAGNEGFTELENEGTYRSFPADEDGIIPLTDLEWFSDDTTYRFRDFVRKVWGEEHLQDNLDFVAESLCLHAIKPKRAEPSLETIRRYLSTQFYKDHLKTYKKRPIYWLFSSGKQKAFECLVYLHRYNEGTLSRMRTEYVTPLIGKYGARLSQLEQQFGNASTSDKTKLKKEMLVLDNKQLELRTFDDKLKHHADMRIKLDLDDGVKVNYGKFSDLLTDVKSVCGKLVN